MLHTIQRICSYFFLALLGIYSLGKIILLNGWGNDLVRLVDRASVLPLGVMTLIYIFSGIGAELQKRKIHNALYNFLLVLFFLAFLGVLLFFNFFVNLPQ